MLRGRPVQPVVVRSRTKVPLPRLVEVARAPLRLEWRSLSAEHDSSVALSFSPCAAHATKSLTQSRTLLRPYALDKMSNMYIMCNMSIDWPVTQARNDFGELLNQAAYGDEPIFLTRHGRRLVAMISADKLEHLIELAEDATDAEEADKARKEMARGEAPIPWEDVKAELDLQS